MTARVLVIGLDAAEATLIEKWANLGHLPNLKRVIDRAAAFKVGNSLRTLPGAIWPELVTGVSCGKRAQYYHPAQLHTGEAERRPIEASEVDPEEYYWTRAARAGLKIASLDMPQTVMAPAAGSVQLFEWGLHDRHLGVGSVPEDFMAHVRRHYGAHPVTVCDAHGETDDGYATLLEQLKRGATLKGQLFEETLRSASWDLFTATFSECHCTGHQFWHFQDPAHPWYRPDHKAAYQTALRDVYQRIDDGIGRLIAAAGPEAETIIVASHGMGCYTGGPYLLAEVLARMGCGSTAESHAARLARRLKKGQSTVARAARNIVRNIVGPAHLRRAQAGLGVLHQPLTNPRTRAIEIPNNRCGAVRLNLKGREPLGGVAPGNEAIALIEDIRAVLLELRDPKTGEPIVEETLTARETFGLDHHPDVPDLMVVFRDDLGLLETCISPRYGEIDAPIYQRDMPRSGDHTTQSRIWVSGARVTQPRFEEQGNVLDLAPTVLDLLGLSMQADGDGRPLLRA